MAGLARLFALAGVLLLGLFSSGAHAECGGNIQCIGVGPTPGDALRAHHNNGPKTFTLAFGDQGIDTTSASETIHVAAVTGPSGTMADLGPVSIVGPDAAHFSVTGGTCSTTNGPVHQGALCTITVAFNPATVGPKSATVSVPLNPPACANCITGRSISLSGAGTLPPPTITSGLAASGSTGVPFPSYRIAATNNPTGYNATGLPPGLGVDTRTGLITGVPTSDGSFNTIISASNASGTDTETLVIVIALNVPVITSPATAIGAAGQPFSYQIAATNTPIQFGARGLPPGLSVEVPTGLISGTPTGGGSFAASITATNAVATANQALAIAITPVPPASGGASLTVPLNTATPLDLSPFISGPAIRGVRITAGPSYGEVTTSGTTVTYTPVTNYFGPDEFSYVAVNNDGDSPIAAVSVSVVGRPDPASDPTVVGLIRAQSEAAKRFSRTQIVNFRRRMESLHASAHDSGNGAGLATGRQLREIGVAGPGIGDAQTPFQQLFRAREEGGLLSPEQTSALVTAMTTRSLELSYSGGRADGLPGASAGTGVWIGGTASFGSRDDSDDSDGLSFSTDGISAGIDHRFGDRLLLGLGLGYARGRTDVGQAGSRTRSHGASATVYGSYRPTDNTFIDGLVGYGVLRFDTERHVVSVDQTARSHREGDQWFASLAAGYEHRAHGLLLSPYARLDLGTDRLDQVREDGAGLNALTYLEETRHTRKLSVGLHAESPHQTRFGWVLPRLRVEYGHDFEDGDDTGIRYADQPTGPRYRVASGGRDRDSLLIGLGGDFVFRNGLTLGLEYETVDASNTDHDQSISLWLSKDLEETPRSRALSSTRLFEDPIRVEAGYGRDQNLNRARDPGEKLSDSIHSIRIGTATAIPVSDHTRLTLSGFLDARKLKTYNGLDRASAGLKAEFQYRGSSDFDAVTLGLFGRVIYDEYDSELRSGPRYSVGLNARQALTDRIDLFGEIARNIRRGENPVFETSDYSARFNLDYVLGRKGILYLGGEYRDGDTVRSGHNSTDYLGGADATAIEDAYGHHHMTANRYEAETTVWTLGYNLPFGPRDSIDLSWRRAISTPKDADDSPYSANQLSVVYLMRF